MIRFHYALGGTVVRALAVCPEDNGRSCRTTVTLRYGKAGRTGREMFASLVLLLRERGWAAYLDKNSGLRVRCPRHKGRRRPDYSPAPVQMGAFSPEEIPQIPLADVSASTGG